MSELVDVFDKIFKYNGVGIEYYLDNTDVVWFHAKQILELLGYGNPSDVIKKMVDIDYKIYVTDLIPQHKKYFPGMDPQTRFINEHGLYKLITRSNMPFAKKFQFWLYNKVLPSIRRYGQYISYSRDKQLISKLNDTLKKYKKELRTYKHNNKQYNFPDGGYVYIIQPIANDPLHKKIGKSNHHIYNRLSTLNSSVPYKNKVLYVLAVEDPTAVEYCIKAYLHKYKASFRDNKEYYYCSTKTMINVFNNCAYLVSNNIFCFDCPYPINFLPKPINHKTLIWNKNHITEDNIFRPYVDKKYNSRQFFLDSSSDDGSFDSEDSESIYSIN